MGTNQLLCSWYKCTIFFVPYRMNEITLTKIRVNGYYDYREIDDDNTDWITNNSNTYLHFIFSFFLNILNTFIVPIVV